MRLFLVPFFLTVSLWAQPAVTDPQIAQDQAEKLRVDARKALLDSQLALMQSEKALSAAQKANPNADAIAQATSEAGRINAETTLVNAKKAAGAALVPDLSKVPGIAGDITVTGSPVEGVAMAYEALGAITKQMAGKIVCGSQSVVLYAKADLDGLDAFRAWEAQVASVKSRLEEVKRDNGKVRTVDEIAAARPSNPVALLGAIGPALESLNKLIGMFRVDTTFTFADVTLDERALLARLAPQLGETCKVYYPAAMPPGTGGASTSVEASLTELRTLRDEIANLSFKRAQDKVAADAKLKAASEANRPIWQDHIANLTALTKTFNAAHALVDSVEASLLKVDDGSGLSQLVRLRRAAEFAKVLKDASPGFGLQVSIQKLASNTRTRKNAFLGTRLDFAGGAVASYLAFELANGSFSGLLKSSGQFTEYSIYRKQGNAKAK